MSLMNQLPAVLKEPSSTFPAGPFRQVPAIDLSLAVASTFRRIGSKCALFGWRRKRWCASSTITRQAVCARFGVVEITGGPVDGFQRSHRGGSRQGQVLVVVAVGELHRVLQHPEGFGLRPVAGKGHHADIRPQRLGAIGLRVRLGRQFPESRRRARRSANCRAPGRPRRRVPAAESSRAAGSSRTRRPFPVVRAAAGPPPERRPDLVSRWRSTKPRRIVARSDTFGFFSQM